MREAAGLAVREGSVAALVRELTGVLEAAGIEEARREARDILAAVHDAPRFWAALHEQELVSAERADACRRAARHQSAGAPFAYAVGRSAFRNLTLHVDERVLSPRQETEMLVDEILTRERLNRGGILVEPAHLFAQGRILVSQIFKRRLQLAILTTRVHRLHQPLFTDQGIDDEDQRHEDEKNVQAAFTNERRRRRKGAPAAQGLRAGAA